MVSELLPVPAGLRDLAWWDRAQPPKYLHPAEVHRVLDATTTPRDHLLVNVLWTSGPRIGEALLVRPCDFDQSASDWLWETDAEGRLQNVSQRFAQVLNELPAELEGVSFFAAIFRDVQQAATQQEADWQKLNHQIMTDAVYLPLYWGNTLMYRNPRMTNVTCNNAQAFGNYDFVNVGVS